MPFAFDVILEKYRRISFSEKDKGARFERLMKAYLLTDPKYAHKFKKVWLWDEFPGRRDLGGGDTGIDLVALTNEGDYWAVQCKCYLDSSVIDKPAVDSFLSTSSRRFKGEDLKTTSFSHRLWISTTNKWGLNAQEAIKNQSPPVSRINLFDLRDASVDWGKLEKGISGELARNNRRDPKAHQIEAITKTNEHFKLNDRGKLIMACGTGKTFTSLKIAENETNGKGLILFLVPSIALLGQTLNEWCTFASESINAVCICSDPEITRSRKQLDDIDTSSVVDLALPASTNVQSIVNQFASLDTSDSKGLTVVFSTYQSIDVISKAQCSLKESHPEFSQFDLIICDEAHRTTGVSLAGEDESSFTKVHNNDFIKAKKRLYMTATPRLYSDEVKSKVAQADAYLCSMDDVSLYGEDIYRIGFGEAVEKDLLTDYKVIILTLNENDVPPAVQKMIADKESEINTDDASKLVGCINALSKQILGDEGLIKQTDPEPMRRAVAFCQSIAASRKITNTFNVASETYISELPKEKQGSMQSVSSKHIDGTMNATERSELLSWLKSEPDDKECRVLTNVRCLSEGVDVPSLDAVLFLSARNSQVDVVQSVGRVMRTAPGKKYGYIIIPIVVPSNIAPDTALDNNDRYRVVWTVLNALRAHDDRFNATVNKIELNKNKPPQIIVGRPDVGFDKFGNPIYKTDNDNGTQYKELAEQLSLQFQQLQSVVFGKMVDKVGEKGYWEQWVKSVGEIAQRHKVRITKLIDENEKHHSEFELFLKGLHKNINPSLSQEEAIEMLSQHIITKPVFDALFEGYSFVSNNPMSKSMQKMLDLLEEQALEKDTEILEKFYKSVKVRASGIDNAEGRQRVIIELYERFFKTAFPDLVEKLGIVYTPIEIVDFINYSVNDILAKEFGRNISDENIHILDPFTGTGTFIVRLIQSGIIRQQDLERKYTSEIHANEIVLLAYYIAAINIENAFHDRTPDPYDGIGKENYIPFEGIVLTDTFQLGETVDGEKLFSEMFPQNSKRVLRQKKAPLRIIIGNPPYYVGQRSENDLAQSQEYPVLSRKISDTYGQDSESTLKRSLHDAYIKAFRWSSDRLDKENGGIIAFITNNGWIDKPAMAGFRKSLAKEFSSIYVFNLRGSIRGLSATQIKKEGQNVFDIMTGVAITVLVKQKTSDKGCSIFYHDIGDYLSKAEKKSIISSFRSIANSAITWTEIIPNENGDWINLRSDLFETFTVLASEKKYNLKSESFFCIQGPCVSTGRDAWVINFSSSKIEENMRRFIEFYNSQVDDYVKLKSKDAKLDVNKFISTDSQKISWTVNLKNSLEKGLTYRFDRSSIRTVCYRPFCKEKIYFDNAMIERPGISRRLFPNDKLENIVIVVSGVGDRKGFSALVCDNLVSYDFFEKTQCFPLYYFEEIEVQQKGLFDTAEISGYQRRDAVTDYILNNARKLYGKSVIKEDIFYYVYGILHSFDYREVFLNDLRKTPPRLPLVEDVKDFWNFCKAGRKLAQLHLNYDKLGPYSGVVVSGEFDGSLAVRKMRFADSHSKNSIVFNDKVTISNIPSKVYDYIVSGRSAVEWIVERYQTTTNKESLIESNPNDWAYEMHKPGYILELLLSVINMSAQSIDIINSLPKLEFGKTKQ
jgi:predicted helicase